ncbi:hypothetical protein EJ06DRAFT_385547 [Trichodelitschia bisporula]|uniref:Uncharacterized protein n=1 Tax=Trichodelitschia bisporula TaxID=703511 RepID=A0A6G1HZG2_9PEZI|nr:hypothetical protein EJ06DRAFT_385547 [Trichodelitschia bisporula]
METKTRFCCGGRGATVLKVSFFSSLFMFAADHVYSHAQEPLEFAAFILDGLTLLLGVCRALLAGFFGFLDVQNYGTWVCLGGFSLGVHTLPDVPSVWAVGRRELRGRRGVMGRSYCKYILAAASPTMACDRIASCSKSAIGTRNTVLVYIQPGVIFLLKCSSAVIVSVKLGAPGGPLDLAS